MLKYREGEIVMAKILDPDGNPCEDPHPALIFRTSQTVASVWVVGITGAFSLPHPWYHMPLEYDPAGHPETGLYKPSALKANWVQLCLIADIRFRMGYLRPELYERATDLVHQVIARKKSGQSL